MESDVLELECNIDDLEQKPKTPPPAPKAEIAPAEADLKNSRLLWISGIDETMKANDFRVAFEPHGKGSKKLFFPKFYKIQLNRANWLNLVRKAAKVLSWWKQSRAPTR